MSILWKTLVKSFCWFLGPNFLHTGSFGALVSYFLFRDRFGQKWPYFCPFFKFWILSIFGKNDEITAGGPNFIILIFNISYVRAHSKTPFVSKIQLSRSYGSGVMPVRRDTF